MSNGLGTMVRGWATALLVAAGLVSGAATAAFIDQGGGVVLDTVTGLEWEQNANHGPFEWAGAVAYGTNLTLDGGGWHLATIEELDGLYDDLFATGVCLLTSCTGSIGGFTEIQPTYWSSTEVIPGSAARLFHFNGGTQGVEFEGGFSLWAWAVRPAAVVPEPATLALLAFGLAGLGFARRRKKA